MGANYKHTLEKSSKKSQVFLLFEKKTKNLLQKRRRQS